MPVRQVVADLDDVDFRANSDLKAVPKRVTEFA